MLKGSFVLAATAAIVTMAVPGTARAAGVNSYLVHNLVANIAGVADVTDPNLKDPWGVSSSTTSPFWVSNHFGGTSTLYNGAGAITPLVVTVPPGASHPTGTGKPTGQIQNSTTSFIIPGSTKASFIFASEDGVISAWNAGAVSVIVADNSVAGASYKGLALNPSATAPLLYAANFTQNKIDVFNGSFAATTVPGGFVDAAITAGFAPFNIQALGGKLYVTYAKQTAGSVLDTAGAGNGFVDVFDFNGNLLTHLVSNGVLNSPWGVALAPTNWGAFGGALLVGNFGDGAINAFDPTTGALLGTLKDSTGTPISLPGLWGLIVGNGRTGGDVNTVYFMQGNPAGAGTARGILGSIAPPAAISTIYNGASWSTGTVSPGEVVSIIGQTVGPSPAVPAVIPATGTLGTTLGTTSVTFNGLAAPVLYASGSQTNVIVPYGIAGSATASVVMKVGTQTTAAFSVPVVVSAPGVFTSNAAGTLAALVLNADGTVNTAANPAAKGSPFVLFATGEGQTNPPGQDGLIETGFVLREPVLPVSLTVGAQTAQVLFAGSEPGGISGVMEVEAVIPAGAATGPAVMVLTVGTGSTQANVTVFVK
jgi:uncharacterized protein (TIGR03118 family)